MDSNRIAGARKNPGAGAVPGAETRIALVHRVIVPDADYPKEYAILVTDRRSIFIRQPKTRNTFWLRGEMKWGTALVTDVTPKTLDDYAGDGLEKLSADPASITIRHGSVVSFVLGGDRPIFRAREFWVKWTMERQKEVYQVYNFEVTYRTASEENRTIRFFAVPLGAYVKPRRQFRTREYILREYAGVILELYGRVLPSELGVSSAADRFSHDHLALAQPPNHMEPGVGEH